MVATTAAIRREKPQSNSHYQQTNTQPAFYTNNNNNNINNKGKPLAWDVTVPDTYAESESHIADTVSTPGAAAHQAAQHKIAKYSKLACTHMFYPIAIETAGTWDDMAIEPVNHFHCYRKSNTERPSDNTRQKKMKVKTD